jgi:hypothetical protein
MAIDAIGLLNFIFTSSDGGVRPQGRYRPKKVDSTRDLLWLKFRLQ